MLLSIIIPVYNTKIELLQDCIKSVKEIKNINYEVILIDDGSKKENSFEYKKICNKNIKYIWQTNQGVSAARNHGITKAKGKYIMFVDSDDIIYAKNLNKKTLEKNYDMVLYDCNYIRPKNKITIMKGINASPGILKQETILTNFIENCGLHFPSFKLYLRKFIVENNITFNTNMIQGEDAIFNLDIIEKKPTIFYINKSIYGYNYDYSTSSSRWDKNPNKMFDNLEILYNRKEQVIKNNNLEEKYFKILYKMYVNNIFSLCVDKHNNKQIILTAKKLMKEKVLLKYINGTTKIKYNIININNKIIYKSISLLRKIYLTNFKKNY